MMSPTALLTPWYRRLSGSPGGGADQAGSIVPTTILDHRSPVIRQLVARARHATTSPDALGILEAAHALIREEVRPVYALEESTPASRVLVRGQGSCSQRLAILESVARALGVATRVRALLIDRSFWYPRFPRLRFALPDHMLLVWPEFRFDGSWRSAAELFGPIGCRAGGAFANHGAETLFEAVGRCAVDWDGHSEDTSYDLSRFVRADLGYFPDRDHAFARLGQTLCTPSRYLADPVLRRIAA